MWKLAESLNLSLVICCFLHNCPYKIQLETRFLASHSAAVHFAIITRHSRFSERRLSKQLSIYGFALLFSRFFC